MRIVEDNFFSIFNSYYPFDRYILKMIKHIDELKENLMDIYIYIYMFQG